MATRAPMPRENAPVLFEQRAAERRNSSPVAVQVRRLGSKPGAGVLLDISIYGARIRAPQRFRRGDRVWIGFGGATPVAAAVMWAEDGVIGCRFDAAIERDLLRMLVQQL